MEGRARGEDVRTLEMWGSEFGGEAPRENLDVGKYSSSPVHRFSVISERSFLCFFWVYISGEKYILSSKSLRSKSQTHHKPIIFLSLKTPYANTQKF
jgi:hypothetical protein